MKSKSLLRISIVAVLLLSTFQSRADYTSTFRKKCNVFPKYALKGWMVHHYFDMFMNETGKSYEFVADHGCSFASIYKTSPINPVTNQPYALLDVRIGSSPHYTHWTTSNVYSCGSSFSPPANVAGLDSVGIARSELRLDFDITGVSPNSSIVTLNNFSGVLSAKKSTLFGAAFQTLLWKGLSTLDSLVSPSNLILDGSVRIENGQVIMAGMFAPGDFIISNAVDPQTGDSIIQVEPVPGLQKTFTVAGDTTDNSIAVTTSSSAGFGTFDPNQVYVNSRLPSTIPTLSEWGMMIFAGLLVTVGAFYISKG